MTEKRFEEGREEYSRRMDQHLNRPCDRKKSGLCLDLKKTVMARMAKKNEVGETSRDQTMHFGPYL